MNKSQLSISRRRFLAGTGAIAAGAAAGILPRRSQAASTLKVGT